MNTIVKNNSKRAIIVPGVGELAMLGGLVAPGATLEVGESLTQTDFMRHLESVGDIVITSAPVASTSSDELEALRDQAEMLGITVNKRWGAAKLQEEIDKVAG